MAKDRGEFPRYIMAGCKKSYAVAFIGGVRPWLVVDDCRTEQFKLGERNYGWYNHFPDSHVTEIPQTKTVPFERDDYKGITQVVGKATGGLVTILAVTSRAVWYFDTNMEASTDCDIERFPKFLQQLDGSPLTKEVIE